MAVAVFGSIGMDITAYLERLPKPGETLAGTSYNWGLGGKGANQAVAATKLGSDVTFVCRLGVDDFAKAAFREITSYGVKADGIASDSDGATGLAIIYVGQGGQNAIAIVSGSNMRMDASDVARARPALEKADVLLLQLEVPLAASLEAAKIVRSHGGRVVLDPAPVPKDGLPKDVWRHADIATPNEVETAALIGWQPTTLDEALKAASELRGQGLGTAIVKLGAKGLAYASAETEGTIEPFKVNAIDTVAAGDCFNGGLAHALESGMPLAQALRFASACGALSTTKKGAASAAPTKAEVEKFLNA
ncbi:MAG: ribokinase [Aestuariivirga sp.]